MFKLIIEDDEGKTTVVPILRDEITIGRKEGNNIRLTERNVSRQHARIAKDTGHHVSIEDLDSYNGIRVNGDRIQVKTPVSIQEGDLIEIGDYHLAIQLEGTTQPALAGATTAEESTQRVTMQALAEGTSPGMMAPEEVTAQVMAPQGDADLPHAEPDVELGPPPVANEPTMRLAAPPPDPEPEEPPQRRPEPTAIIRTSDLMAPPAAATVSSTEHPRLVVMSTALAGGTFNLTKDETVIGRTDDNEIILDHRSVSRNHAKIVKDGARYAVVDLNSANGVLVNGEEYKRIDLRRGDVIELGHVKLRFVEAGEAFTIPASELERLRREDPALDGTDAGDSTGSMSTRSVRALPGGGGKPFPVKTVAIALGALVLVGGIAGVAMMGGSSGQTQNPPREDPQNPPNPPPDKPTAASSDTRVKPTPPPDRPNPTPTPPKVDDRAAEAARTMTAARAAMKAGEFVKARELFAKVADQDGEARRALEQVERELKARQQLDEALERKADDPEGAKRALEAVPEGTRARERAVAEIKALRQALLARWLREGEKSLANGDWQTAKQYAEDILDEDKSNRDAPKLLEKAKKAQRAAQTRPAPQNPRPNNPQPTPNENSGGSSKAAEAKKALEEGNKSILLGNFDEAVAKGKLALKLDPGLIDAHKLLGVAYARQGRYCDAKHHYKKFIELNPGSAMVDRIKQILQGEELKSCP